VHPWGPWTDFTQPSVAEQRTHFGLWCTLSSPLTLSLDFTNSTAVASVWDIITNTHAIAVNQAWAGSPGTVFKTGGQTIVLGPSRGFREQWGPAGEWRGTEQHVYQVSVPTWQAWYKPLPDGGAAIFVANHGNVTANITIDFIDVPGLGPPAPQFVCPAEDFSHHLGDVQCFGLSQAHVVGGRPVTDARDCCAACAAAGAACITWQWCAAGARCAAHTPGCFIGSMGNCHNSTDGWESYARSGPAPSPPSPPPLPPGYPKLFVVTDVWTQAVVRPQATRYSVPALASHDSVFITVAPLAVDDRA